MMKEILQKFILLPSQAAVLLISLYQSVLSPDHSWLKFKYPHGFCRLYPSCSQYSKEAFVRFGFLKGLYLSVRRLLKCNPFTDPKVDLLSHS